MKKFLIAALLLLLALPTYADVVASASPKTAGFPSGVTGPFTIGTSTSAGNGTCTFKGTISGGSATDNFLNCTGTFPGTLTTTTRGVSVTMTRSTGNSDQQTAYFGYLASGATSSGGSFAAIVGENTVASNSPIPNASGTTYGAAGVAGVSSGNGSSGYNLGVRGLGVTGANGNSGVGVFGGAFSGGAQNAIGVMGGGHNNSTGAGIGGLFWAGQDGPPTVGTSKVALVADNTTGAINIFEARDNGTAVFTIADAGVVSFGSSATAANAISIQETAGCITFEGTTANTVQSRLCVVDPTVADQQYSLPNNGAAVTANILAYNTANGVVISGGSSLQMPTLILGNSAALAGGLLQTGSNGSAIAGQIGYIVALTPDGDAWQVGSTSESISVYERADSAFDFNNGRCGTSACGDPALILHSRDQVTTEYGQLSVENATGAFGLQSNLAEIRIGGSKTAITEGSAQAIIRVGIPTSTNVYGMTVFYTVYDINGSDYVGRTGSVKVQGGNKSGTATCTINTTQDQETEDGSQIVTSNAATLTYTWTNAVSTTNCDLSLNATSSEGVNTYGITWTAILTGNSSAITVTPQ